MVGSARLCTAVGRHPAVRRQARACHRRSSTVSLKPVTELNACKCCAQATPRSHPGKAGQADCSIMKSRTRLQLLVTSNAQRISPRHRCCQLKHTYAQTLTHKKLISMWSRSIAARKTQTNRICSIASSSVGCAQTKLAVHEDPGPESRMDREPN